MKTPLSLLTFLLLNALSFSLLAAPSSEEALLELSPRAALPPEKPTEERFFESLNLTSITLPNGMHILLKPMSESEEIQVSLIAEGGYTAFSPEQFTAAKYCGSVFFDAGFDGVDAETLSNFLFRYNLEIALRMRPFQRFFACDAPPSSTQQLLAILHHLFLDTKEKLPPLKQVRRSFMEALEQRQLNDLAYFEDLYVFLNSGGHPYLDPTTTPQVLSIDYPSLLSAYKQSFTNPGEFTAIFVGDFDLDVLRPLLLRYLGSIPAQAPSSHWPGAPVNLLFPQEEVKQSLTSRFTEEHVTRLTFPLPVSLTKETLPRIDLITQLIERRLRETLLAAFGSTQAIDIQYYLPLFPRTSPVWLTLQYRCDEKVAETIQSFCLKELQKLKEDGITQIELEKTKEQLQRVDTFWKGSEDYWLHTLMNWTQWHWDIEDLNPSKHLLETFTVESLNPLLKEWCSFTTFTLLTLIPEK